MQSLVDTLIGNVLGHIANEFGATNPPVIIFTSDHGDFGGSHNLHAKGGALYDEAYNVPLLVQWTTQSAPYSLSFLCSSVDILPLIYSAALGNESWRTASSDMVHYLKGRESLLDVIFNSSPFYRRTVSVPNGAGGMQTLPYVLLSTDEYATAYQWNDVNLLQPKPTHAIGIRTMDSSHNLKGSDNTMNFFGGAKLGMYTYWLDDSTYPNPTPSVSHGETQFEFYNYYLNNYGETGNEAFHSGVWNAATAGEYLNAYNNIMAAEFYNIYPQIAAGYNTALNAYMWFHMNSAPNTVNQTYPPSTIPPP